MYPEICGYCGNPSPTTRDHVPPKGIFPPPRPSDLVTIPACTSCNQSASETDERFRAYLSLHVGVDTPTTRQLWDPALRSIRRKRSLRQRLLADLERVWTRTSSGIITGRAYRGLWDSEAHDTTIERVIRGLYFHHYGEVLGSRANVRAQWYRRLTPEILEVTEDSDHRSIGDGQFVYRYGRAMDSPLHSVWLFQFHGRHWAGGHTTPIEANSRVSIEFPRTAGDKGNS